MHGIYRLNAIELKALLTRAEDKNRPCPATAARLRRQLALKAVETEAQAA